MESPINPPFISDTEHEHDEPLILTPETSDSEFEDLLETDSLGERSTTSTVPTQNSNVPSSRQPGCGPARRHGLHNSRQLRNSRGGGLNGDLVQEDLDYSPGALYLLKGLVWTSLALSAIVALGGYFGMRETIQYMKAYPGLSGRFNAFRGHSSVCPGMIHAFRLYLFRMSKRRDNVVNMIFPHYRGYRGRMRNLLPYLVIDAFQLPEKWVWFSTTIRNLLYVAAYIYTAIILYNLVSTSINFRRNNNRRNIRMIWIRQYLPARVFEGFKLRDLELVPLLGFIAHLPYDSIVLRLIGLGPWDRRDDVKTYYAFQYFVLIGFYVKRRAMITGRWRGSTLGSMIYWFIGSCIIFNLLGRLLEVPRYSGY